MTERLERLGALFVVAFGLTALALGYWGILRAPGLLARPDNPRLVESELRVQRGRILDRGGAVLAETAGEPGALTRLYRQPTSPAVGYYSLRHGVAGVEAAYDAVLRGQTNGGWLAWWDSWRHRQLVGRDVQLTLDQALQEVADRALGDQLGAVVLLDARSGEILALASHTSFDPNQLDEQFETLEADETAPLLNRATQALYQPGGALQPFLLAAALDHGLIQPDATLAGWREPIEAGGAVLSCAIQPFSVSGTIVTALSYSCPAPFVDLALALEAESLEAALGGLGLLAPPSLPLALASGTRPALDQGDRALADDAAGQGKLTLSPLQLAWALAALANDGTPAPLRLVRRIGTASGGWEIVVPPAADQAGGVSPEAAETVLQAMVAAVAGGPAVSAAVPDVDVAGHVALAVAGPGGEVNSWFLGVAPALAAEPYTRYVVVVLLEAVHDPVGAAGVGGELFRFLQSRNWR